MIRIGLIQEGKVPADNRVALTPDQCKWLLRHRSDMEIWVEPSTTRCYSNREYELSGAVLSDDLTTCDILLGIKEVPVERLIPQKTYLFFSHTKKKQSYNQTLFRAMISKEITLIDYECLEHEDGQRLLGFGFFAGVVGAHNGVMAYGNRTGLYALDRVYKQRSFRDLIYTYFGLKLPNLKIAVTGSGRVAHGILEIMNLMGIHEVEPSDYLSRRFSYPVYTQLKGSDLYRHRIDKTYNRLHFHEYPAEYECLYLPYSEQTDILMNGIYWDKKMPRLFERNQVQSDRFITQTIADITDDADGSVPINLGDQTIENPIYGVDRTTLQKTAPYLANSIDVMAVGNLPNELARDASRYFGEQLLKHLIDDLVGSGSSMIERATMLRSGKLTKTYEYLREYAGID